MNTNLTIDDINILIESIDSWKSRRFASEMMGDLFTTMLIKDKDKLAEIEIKKKEQALEKKVSQEREKQTAELLKAKLVMLKQEMFTKELPKEIA